VYARVTTFAVKPEKEDEAAQLAIHLLPAKLRTVPGLKQFIDLTREGGSGLTIAIYESKEVADAALPKLREILGRFQDMRTSLPVVTEYEVLLDEILS
jgi:hypothetical protein